MYVFGLYLGITPIILLFSITCKMINDDNNMVQLANHNYSWILYNDVLQCTGVTYFVLDLQ